VESDKAKRQKEGANITKAGFTDASEANQKPNSPPAQNTMKTALFHNFTNKPFTGYWDGKAKTFQAGERKYMPQWQAEHYAKHLANQVLLEQGKETATSPKFPEQAPLFLELFNKACIVEADETDQSETDLNIDIANKPAPEGPTVVDKQAPQIVHSPDENEDDGDFEAPKTAPAAETPATPAPAESNAEKTG
jgi:hypothetical protein